MKVFVALSVLSIVGTVYGLKCFHCNSHSDSACNDDFKANSTALRNAFTQTCNETEGVIPFCRKVKYAIERVHNTTESRVQRDCGYKRRENYDCYQKRSEDYVIDTCQCDQDYCNGAPSFFTSVTTMVVITLPIVARYL